MPCPIFGVLINNGLRIRGDSALLKLPRAFDCSRQRLTIYFPAWSDCPLDDADLGERCESASELIAGDLHHRITEAAKAGDAIVEC